MSNKKAKVPTLYTPAGIASYPHLVSPDNYKGKNQYKVKLVMEKDEAFEKFEAQAREYFDEKIAEYVAENPKVKNTKHVKYDCIRDDVDEDGDLTGKVYVIAKMNAEYEDKKTGKVVKLRPEIVDAKNKPCRPASIWGGSTLRLALKPYFSANGAEITLAWRLVAVQIIELVKGGGSGANFGETDGYTADEDEDDDDSFGGNTSTSSNDNDGDEEF